MASPAMASAATWHHSSLSSSSDSSGLGSCIHKSMQARKLHGTSSCIRQTRTMSTKTLLDLRGGGRGSSSSTSVTVGKVDSSNSKDNKSGAIGNFKKASILTLLGLSASYLIYTHRHQLFDKQFLQDKTLELLQDANNSPLGIFYYSLGMAAWETIGLSTIPIETAAGMAFGWQRAILASTAGKLFGAGTAFLLGRHVLHHWVRTQLETNDNFRLIEASVANKPLVTAILLKYSCFPEFVKNFGTSLLKPIPLWGFLLATLVHGGPFTCLWSWLGDDTAARLKYPDLPPNRALQSTMVVAMTVGLLLSPAAMAWWIRDLRKQHATTTMTQSTSTKTKMLATRSSTRMKKKL